MGSSFSDEVKGRGSNERETDSSFPPQTPMESAIPYCNSPTCESNRRQRLISFELSVSSLK